MNFLGSFSRSLSASRHNTPFLRAATPDNHESPPSYLIPSSRITGAAAAVITNFTLPTTFSTHRTTTRVEDDAEMRLHALTVEDLQPQRLGVCIVIIPPRLSSCLRPLKPQMSMFLNDVLESYRVQGLVPRLSVSSVEAKLCKVGVRLGGISKNT